MKNLIFAIFVINLGSAFQHGYHKSALNIPSQIIKEWMIRNGSYEYIERKHITIIWSSTVSVFAVGAIIGGFLIGLFADNFGRKKSLKFNNIIVLAGIALMTFSKKSESYKMFIFGRLLVGVSVGLYSGLCPMYLIEIAPDYIRGAIGCSYHCVMTCGILLSEFAGCFLGTEDNWEYIFVIAVGPAILQLILLPFCPESPKFLLITQEQDKKAEEALQWLKGTEDVREDLELLKQEDNLVKQLRDSSLKRIFRNRAMANAVVCCIALHIAQQGCGMNVVIKYFFSRL